MLPEAGWGQTVLLVSVHLSKAGPHKLEWSANDQLQTIQYLDNDPVDVSAKRTPHSWKVHAPRGVWTAAPLDAMAPSKITSCFKPDQSPRTLDNVASPKNLAALSTPHNKVKFAIENGGDAPESASSTSEAQKTIATSLKTALSPAKRARMAALSRRASEGQAKKRARKTIEV